MTQFCALENLPGAEITRTNLRARYRRPTSFIESLLFYLFICFLYLFIYLLWHRSGIYICWVWTICHTFEYLPNVTRNWLREVEKKEYQISNHNDHTFIPRIIHLKNPEELNSGLRRDLSYTFFYKSTNCKKLRRQ